MLAVQLLVNATINVYGHGHEKTEYCRTEENCQISARTLCPKKSDKIPVTTSSSDNYDKLDHHGIPGKPPYIHCPYWWVWLFNLTSPVSALWAKRDERGQFSTANTCMQPSLACLCRLISNSSHSIWVQGHWLFASRTPFGQGWIFWGPIRWMSFEQTIKHRVSGCIVLYSIGLRTSGLRLMNSHSEILHVFCDAHQLFWKIWWICISTTHTMTRWLLKKQPYKSILAPNYVQRRQFQLLKQPLRVHPQNLLLTL